MKIIQFFQQHFKIIVLSIGTLTMFALCVWVACLPHVPITSSSTIGLYGPNGIWRY